MSTSGESSLPTGDLPSLDFSQVEQALASSRNTLGSSSQQFRLVRELGRQCEPQLVEPITLAVDSTDRILVLDQVSADEFHIIRFNAEGDCEGVVAHIPRNSRDGLQHPTSMSVNATGELYFSDADQGAIVKFSGDGRWLESLRTAGSDGGSFNTPRDVDQDGAGRMFVADSFNDRVVRLSASGDLEETWSEFDNPLTGEADDGLYEPCSVCIGSDRTLYIADCNNQRVLAFRQSALIAQWSGSGLFEFPSEVRLARDGQTLFVADRGNLRVRRFRMGPGHQDQSSCTGMISLLRDDVDTSVSGGGDIDILSSGYVTLVNPRRQAVVILDFLEG